MNWDLAQPKRVRHFFSKVVGVTYRNDDGSSRQDAIQDCWPGDRLALRHEPRNRYDPNAVQVCAENGAQLGFIRADIAEDIVDQRARGYTWGACVASVSGGPDIYGCNIVLVIGEPGASLSRIQTYVSRLNLSARESRMPMGLRGKAHDGMGCAGKGCVAVMLVVFVLVVAGLTAAVLNQGY